MKELGEYLDKAYSGYRRVLESSKAPDEIAERAGFISKLLRAIPSEEVSRLADRLETELEKLKKHPGGVSM